MATKTISLRIGVDGKQQVKNDLQDIAKTGNEAGKQVAAGFDTATAASERQAAAYFKLATAARQTAEAQRYQSNMAAALASKQSGGSASDSAAVFKAAEDLAKRSEALRAQIDPLGAAQLRMNVAVKESTGLFKEGAITEAEHAAAVKLAQQEYQVAEKALKGFGASAGLSNAQVMSLTASLRHSLDAIIAGRPPLQALAMEAGNLNFALGGAGLSGVMNLLKSAALSIVSPVGLVVSGIAAALGVVVGAGAAYRSFIVDQKNLEASLSGVGRASGATADQMELIAQNTAEAAGISVASARSIEEAFARTGQIGVDMFGGLISVVKRYATTTGEDLDQATKDLQAAFSDPVKGVDLLNQKVGGLDDKTRQYILTLAAQGDKQSAQTALLKALIPQLDDAAAHTTLLGRAMDSVWLASNRAYESFKRTIGLATEGSTAAQQIVDLHRERADALQGRGQVIDLGGTGGAIVQAPRALKDIDADLAVAEAKFNQYAQTAKQTADKVIADAKSIQVGTIARAVSGLGAKDELEATLASLNKALADPAVAKRVTDLQAAKEAQDAYTRAVQTFLTPEERARQLSDLEVKALNDKTPAQKAATAAERERIEIAGKVISSAQAQSDIEQARIKTLRSASKEEQNHAATIARETAALDADAAASLRSAEAYLQSATAGAKADAARRALVDSARKGFDADQRLRQILQDTIAQEAEQGAKQVAQVEAEVAARKRLNDQVADGTVTVDQARQQMQIESSLRPLVIAQALAEGKAKDDLTKIIERLRDAMKGANAEDARSAGQEFIAGQKDALALSQRELALQGLGDNARRLEIVRLQTIQQLKRMNIDAEGDEGKAILTNASNVEAVNQQLDLARASRQEIVGMFDDISNKFTDFITSGKADWKSFGDMATDVLKDIAQEMIKLSLINPLKNSLFGTNDPTSSSVGGIFSSLLGGPFGGGGGWGSYAGDFSEFMLGVGHTGAMIGSSAGSGRSISAAMLGRLPRAHTGAMLGPDEVPFIGQVGERVLNRQETKAYNRNQAQPAKILVEVSVATDGKTDAQASAKVANDGGFDLTALIDNATAKNLGNPNSQTSKTMRHRYGASEKRVAR